MVIILVQLQCTCIGFPDVDEFLKSSYCTSDARGRDGRSMDGQRWCVLAQCVSSTVLSEQLGVSCAPAGRQLEKLLRENSTADALRKHAPSLPVRSSSIMY
eukprot:COSAG02_NODE_10090_length_2027_cov_59.184129_1_plen_101_part_10